MSDTTAQVEATGLTMAFGTGSGQVLAVDNAELTAHAGQIVAVVGPSGSGKSTLLQLLAGLDRPDSGSVRIAGTEITSLKDRALTRLRRERIGFVFQSFQLLPRMTAEANITLPLRLAGADVDPGAVDDLARALGIADRLGHYPGQLSGGQQQRVAVARALLPQPDVIFADEPTGALDTESAGELMDLFEWAAAERGQTLVIVTHDERVTARAHAVYRMNSGTLTRGK